MRHNSEFQDLNQEKNSVKFIENLYDSLVHWISSLEHEERAEQVRRLKKTMRGILYRWRLGATKGAIGRWFWMVKKDNGNSRIETCSRKRRIVESEISVLGSYFSELSNIPVSELYVTVLTVYTYFSNRFLRTVCICLAESTSYCRSLQIKIALWSLKKIGFKKFKLRLLYGLNFTLAVFPC